MELFKYQILTVLLLALLNCHLASSASLSDNNDELENGLQVDDPKIERMLLSQLLSELSEAEENYDDSNSNNNNRINANGGVYNYENDMDNTNSGDKRSAAFLRFGRSPAYLRFGRGQAYLRFGKRSPAYLRFGRGPNPAFLRFGRSQSPSSAGDNEN